MQFVDDTVDEGEWGKGLRLEPVPRLEEDIHLRRHGVVQGGEVNGKTIVEGGGKEVDHHWLPRPQLVDHLLSQGPLRTDNLVLTVSGNPPLHSVPP